MLVTSKPADNAAGRWLALLLAAATLLGGCATHRLQPDTGKQPDYALPPAAAGNQTLHARQRLFQPQPGFRSLYPLDHLNHKMLHQLPVLDSHRLSRRKDLPRNPGMFQGAVTRWLIIRFHQDLLLCRLVAPVTGFAGIRASCPGNGEFSGSTASRVSSSRLRAVISVKSR